MKSTFAGVAIACALLSGLAANAQTTKPTIVLVHGAFADSSSWNGVIGYLENDGFEVIAIANPLRGVNSDAAYVASVIEGLDTPVVLVGHSYGGSVISEAASGLSDVIALVYVAAFAPDVEETALELSEKFPGSTLGPTLAPPVPIPGGGTDLYIQQNKFRDQFAADVPIAQGRLMAATQRPIAAAALNEALITPAWKDVPAWFVYGALDLNIPSLALAFMAERAQSQETLVIQGASHVVMVSHPKEVAEIIERAANLE